MKIKLVTTAALLSTTLGACASMQPVVVDKGQMCESWKEISRSKKDRLTKITAEQIAGNNASRKAWGCLSS